MHGFVSHITGKLTLFLGPLVELMGALVQAFRRFALRLLGGVPTEAAEAKAAVALAQRPAAEPVNRLPKSSQHRRPTPSHV